MIYGYEETVLHEFHESEKHHEIDPGDINGNLLDVQILDEKRESIGKSGENISEKYHQARYFCVGNICVEINEEKESYMRLAAKQKEQYEKDDADDDDWLKSYAEKSYKQYERFQEEYAEEDYDEENVYHEDDGEEFEEAIGLSAEPEQCEQFLTVPEYANKMLKDTLDDCMDVMPIVRRIKTKETLRKDSSGDLEENFYHSYSTAPSKSDEYFALVAEPKKGFTTWPAIDAFHVEQGAFKIDEYLSSFDTEEDWLYVIYYQGMQEAHCSNLYKYQAIFSLPTWRYPIAQATASIYFVIEVCKAKPKHCPVDVTFKYETYRNVFKPGHLDFNEKWLHHILDAKINLFKTITY